LLDDAYFHINSISTFTPDDEISSDKDDTPGSDIVDDSGDSPDDETSTPTASLHFTKVESLYNIGDFVTIDLAENLQVATRFHRVDLWVAIELPDGSLLFMTENPF